MFLFLVLSSIKACKKCIIQYGVSGHEKELMDGVSAPGVKHPIRTAVVTKNFQLPLRYP